MQERHDNTILFDSRPRGNFRKGAFAVDSGISATEDGIMMTCGIYIL